MIILNAAVEVRYGSLVIVSLQIVALLDVGLAEIMLLLEIVHVVFEQDALAPIIETASLGVPVGLIAGPCGMVTLRLCKRRKKQK